MCPRKLAVAAVLMLAGLAGLSDAQRIARNGLELGFALADQVGPRTVTNIHSSQCIQLPA